jgi:tRNA threonylcarbamoyladenosine modification (KEOPS) complex  Pcc1 subunit
VGFDLNMRPKATGKIRLTFASNRQLNAMADALAAEFAHPAGMKARATLAVRPRRLELRFEAIDSAALRAIFSSHLRLLAASLNVSNALIHLDASRANETKTRETKQGTVGCS